MGQMNRVHPKTDEPSPCPRQMNRPRVHLPVSTCVHACARLRGATAMVPRVFLNKIFIPQVSGYITYLLLVPCQPTCQKQQRDHG
jgi:hypothetical protein